jgi:sulfur carrier protein
MTAPTAPTGFEITLNGKTLHTSAGTLQTLLLEQGYVLQSAFACAINNGFVPRPQWPAQVLQAYDRVDVITPIAGG